MRGINDTARWPLRAARRLGLLTVGLLFVSACSEAPAGPETPDVQASNQPTFSVTPLVSVFGFPGASGTVDLMRRPNGGITWVLRASGLTPGLAFTVWVGNFATDD